VIIGKIIIGAVILWGMVMMFGIEIQQTFKEWKKK